MKIKGRIKYQLYFFLWLCAGAVCNGTFAQTYTPITVSGFTQDVIAESGTDATAVTSTVIDATNHVMYSASFAAAQALLGGVVDNGTIVNGNYTWQLAPFTGNNALYLSNGTVANTTISGTLTLASPAAFSGISLLVFSTEGDNTGNIMLNFTDGTSANAGNYTITDWYDKPNPVYSAFGRIVRISAPTYTSDGVLQNNGRYYKLDVNVPCTSRPKLLQSVTVSFVSGTLSGRILVMAVAGAPYGPLQVTPAITDATCNGSNGSISLTIGNGSTNPNSYFYKWNTSPQQYTPSISGIPAGTYTCTITDLANCTSTYQGTIGSVALAVVTATATPASVCPGGTATISAGATGPAVSGYTWNPGSQSGNTISVSPAATTTYTVSGQDANGCSVTASATVTINPVPQASFTAAPDSICQGSTQTITFTGTAGSSAVYDWNNFAGATVQSGSGAGPYTILFNTPGVYTLQLQVTDGCPSTIASHQVVVSEKPLADLDISPSPICSGDAVTVVFTGTAPGASAASWNWGGGSAKTGSGFGPYSVKYNNGGFVRLTVKNGACTVSATKTVAVTPNPLAAFTPQPPGGCVPATVNFVNQTVNADSWLWTFGDGTTSTDPNPRHVYGYTGVYTVTLEVSNKGQCFDKITQTNIINVSTPPVVAFTSMPGTDTMLEVRMANFIFANQSQYAGSYLWDFGDGGGSTEINPGHKYNAPGNYRVTLYATNGGCTDSVSHAYYKVIPDKDLLVPNAFSPNGDGINERWEIEQLKQYPACTVSVFNRWGQEVFKSQGYQQPWDGRFKGQPVPLATYYYVITLPGKKAYSGWVVILK